MRASIPISSAQTAALVTRLRDRTIPRLTANLARRKLAEIEPGQGPPQQTFVDGREGAALDSVRTGGQIRFVWADLGPILDWIWEELVTRSPVGPERGAPHYRDVHWLVIDGERVEVPEAGEAARISGRSICTFVNARPYSRKIEYGLSLQAPDGVYELVALEAQQRFPNTTIEFAYLSEGDIPVAIPWPVKSSYGFPSITVRTKT
jgi:hypothetical protein